MQFLDGRGAVRARESLSLDFNPRELVARYTPSCRPEAGDAAELQAIYVPSKSRSQNVSRLVARLPDIGVPIYLLPTADDDVPAGTPSGPRVEVLSSKHPDFMNALRGLRCGSDPVFTVAAEHWDLPLKRNFALWHAHAHRFGRILLLDDDIRGLNAARLRAGASALNRWSIAGFFVDEFPDTSLIGHIALALGEPVLPFLGGSCLFIRTDTPVGPFPPIYNEDWIFMAPELAERRVASLGRVRQEPHDPFARASLAVFQEPGEIIADGLFALLSAGRYDQRLDPSVWRTLLSLRRRRLDCLAERTTDPRHGMAIAWAQEVCSKITDLDCARFIGNWERDRERWTSMLRELT
jgi:hypothetical protein